MTELDDQNQSSQGGGDTSDTKSVKRTGGVADYFTILGVGEDLLWKHTQKQREQQQQQQQQQQIEEQQQRQEGEDNQENNNQHNTENSLNADPNQEDQAALMERFYREIIDVTIVTHYEPAATTAATLLNHSSHHTNTPSSVAAPGSPAMLSSSPSGDTDADGTNSFASSRIRTAIPNILPSPSSNSDATTVATTAVSSNNDASHQVPQSTTNRQIPFQLPPSEINGYTLFSKTYPPQKSASNNPSSFNTCWSPGSGGSHQHPPSNVGTSFSHGTETSLPWNNKGKQNSNYCFDANLDPLGGGGLREQVCSTVLQYTEEASSDHTAYNNPTNSNASVGGSSATNSITQGLRRKVESSWKRLNNHHLPSHSKTQSSHQHRSHHYLKSVKFYVGYKRRTPDQDHVPAIADLQLLYVRFPHHATNVSPQNQQQAQQSTIQDHNHYASNSPVTPPGSNAGAAASGLAGRMAAAAGNVLFRNNHSSLDAGLSPNVSLVDEDNDDADAVMPDEYRSFELESLLQLPQGFDQWSIPDAYKTMYIPRPKRRKPPSADRRPKTVLVASPSHGQRRRRQQQQQQRRQSDQEYSHDIPSTESTEEECVEAYMEAAPDELPNPQEDDEEKSSKNNNNHGSNSSNNGMGIASSFVPELFTDVPWEDVEGEVEGQSYWYLPVLAVRKQRTGEEERFHEDAGITDLAVSFCNRAGMAVLPQEVLSEDFDDMMMMDDDNEEFNLLSKTGWNISKDGDNRCLVSAEHQPLMDSMRKQKHASSKRQGVTFLKKTLGSPTILVKRNVPFGFADLAFATRVLERFPLKNYKGLPLPEEELPMFCYPTGCRLHRARFSDAPLSQYYGFVVKNERGDSIYVSCVSFFEPLTRQKIEQLANMSEKRRRSSLAHRRFCERRERRRRRRAGKAELDNGDDQNRSMIESEDSSDDEESENGMILTRFDTMTTFENKTICLVSRYPFWTAFRRFLSHLHILSGATSDLPLERCISHLLLSVPVPKPGGPSVIVPLPALNEPMVLTLPSLKDFPVVDLPYQRLVAVLDIPTIVTVVLGFLALEKKVIIMSSRPSLVLDNCELLRSLLFPFDLCAPYVPRLTEPFMSCLEFPGAIFVGIHDDGSPDGLSAVVRNSPPEDSIIVDLDSGSVDCTGNRYEVLTSAWDIMPATARANLVSELETLCRDAGVVPGQEPLESLVDSAFDATLPSALIEDYDVLPSGETKEPLDDRAIRDAFLRYFCAVLRGYERFLVVPDADFLISGNEWFDTQDFLASASKENVPYLNSLVSTQLFQSFIQRRTEDSDVHCLLFDECLIEYHSSTVPYGRLGGDVESVVSSDNSQPHMLYSLLVDQSASAPYSGIPSAQLNSSNCHDTSVSNADKNSLDENSSKFEGDSDIDSSYAFAKPSMSTMTDISENRKFTLDIASIKHADSTINASGDIITAPSRQDLPSGVQFIYCVDGNPCFPHRLNKSLFLPREPDSWLVEMSKIAPNPSLARSEREIEEANRRRKSATSLRGFHAQKRCLWQLPKLMGSHFLGTFLLCIPAQVSQPGLSEEQESKYLCRALGAMRMLRHKNRIIPDEAAYRALMVACGRSKSDRRIELVKLFGLLRSDGIFPSAVTLGQYTRSLAEGYSKRSAGPPEDSTNEFSGVEVTESMSSKVGGDNRRRSGLFGSNTASGLESALFAMDGNLSTLESAGRKWRQRNNLSSDRTGSALKANGGGNAGSTERSQSNAAATTESRHNRKRGLRSWLPVCVSSSFVSSTTAKDNPKNGAPVKPEDVTFVALWSRTCTCDSCGYIPLEEEVQAGWDAVGGENDVLGAISCPRCGSMVIPMLGYREMPVHEALQMKDPSPQNVNDADFAGLPPQVGPFVDPGMKKATLVTYVSPATLRLSLERYIDELGEGVLSRERLKELDPEVFYNLFWYCARFNLPLPLPVLNGDNEVPPKHCIAFAAWDRTAAERGCYSGARAIATLFPQTNQLTESNGQGAGEMGAIDPFDDYPLLGRFNLQGFYPTVWDHSDLSEILVSLVTVCDSDRRDFKVVVECVLRCNQRRREKFGGAPGDASSDIGIPVDVRAASAEGTIMHHSMELDCYKTILYLAKYQCTTAFHTFFPAVAKPCKGYHYWCAVPVLPIFDRLLRDAVKKVNSKNNNSFAPIPDVSDVALGFRCVFGHLI